VRSLAQQLDDYLEGLMERADPEIMAAKHRATERWLADRVADAALKIGDTAPDFTLPDQSGNPVSLSATLRRGPGSTGPVDPNDDGTQPKSDSDERPTLKRRDSGN